MTTPISRRELLLGAGALGALGLAGCSVPTGAGTTPSGPAASAGPTASSPGAPRTVMVIGAGAAGLAAARALADAGLAVEVLEARDRIGGRVFTSGHWPDLPVDIGASWIHGATGNPVTALAQQIGAPTLATSYDSGEVYISPTLAKAGLLEPDTARWAAYVDAALASARRRKADISLAQAMTAAPEWRTLTATERADLGFYVSATYETEWGVTADRLSARTLDDGELFEGPDLLLPQGYSRIMAHLAEGLAIRTKTAVTAIRLPSQGVTLQAGGADRQAAAVVVTVPLGVLKAGKITIEPGLPERMQTAVDRLEMGVLSKSFFRFDKAFWPTDVDWHEYVGTAAGRWSEWVSFAKAGAPMLLGFNVGEHARVVEAANPQQIIDEATPVLREMFGAKTPAPTDVFTSSWSSDPWALGSYSVNSVGSSVADREALGAPLDSRIFWAGEATEVDYHSTVHGAILSGRRAAAEVIEALT